MGAFTVRQDLITSMSVMNYNLGLNPLNFFHPAADFTLHYFIIILAFFGQSRMN